MAKTIARVLELVCTQAPWARRTGLAVPSRGRSTPCVRWNGSGRYTGCSRIRTFKRSGAPGFAAKAEDIAGLYIEPPAYAVPSPSMTGRASFHVLDRTQPNLPLKPCKCGTMSHD